MTSTDPVPDALFKVIIIGDSGVGKSCFLLQFMEGTFKEDHNVTIGVEYGAKTVTVQDKFIKLQIWDTVSITQAGQESFRAITRTFYRNANAVVLMYDLTRLETFQSLGDWLKEVRQNSDPEVAVFLVGNMSDLAEEEREVETEAGEQFRKENNLQGFLEGSAKGAVNVDQVLSTQVFLKLAELLYIRHREKEASVEPTPVKSAPVVLRPTQPKEKKGKKCC